jgi:hypothetical protein
MKTDGRTIAEEEFDLAVGHIVSFYQSKRTMLKKQVTHWIGKFMICKHENNRLRHKYISSQKQVDVQIHNIRCMREEIAKLKGHIVRVSGVVDSEVADEVEKYYEAKEAEADAIKENVPC